MSIQKSNTPWSFYKLLPKVELHRHLEGSLRLSTMMEIARDHQLELPFESLRKFQSLVQVVDGEPYNFQNFLSKFATLRKFYQSPEIIKRVTRETIQDAAADKIQYLELRFTPVALTRIKGFAMADAMDWVLESAHAASKEFGIKTSLIASVNRHESVELADEVMRLAVDRKDQGIVALDLAGSEAEFPGQEFKDVFRTAKENGLRITIHAGEWGGAEIIKLAIEKLGAERIGHGVRVLEDPRLVAQAKEKGIVFEVCPTSNFQSGVITSINQHPLARMIEAGIKVTLNTDDPSISQIDLSDEYKLSCDVFGLKKDDLVALILNGAESSFLPADQKQELISSLSDELVKILRNKG